MPLRDDSGFEAWYRGLHPRLITALFAASGELDASQDAADEAFLRALERWPRVRDMASPEGWTYKVALNALRGALVESDEHTEVDHA